MATAALVCGILGIIGAWFPLIQYFTFVLAILGIVFGSKARKAAAASNSSSGMATAGLVLGIIGVVCGLAGILCITVFAAAALAL